MLLNRIFEWIMSGSLSESDVAFTYLFSGLGCNLAGINLLIAITVKWGAGKSCLEKFRLFADFAEKLSNAFVDNRNFSQTILRNEISRQEVTRLAIKQDVEGSIFSDRGTGEGSEPVATGELLGNITCTVSVLSYLDALPERINNLAVNVRKLVRGLVELPYSFATVINPSMVVESVR